MWSNAFRIQGDDWTTELWNDDWSASEEAENSRISLKILLFLHCYNFAHCSCSCSKQSLGCQMQQWMFYCPSLLSFLLQSVTLFVPSLVPSSLSFQPLYKQLVHADWIRTPLNNMFAAAHVFTYIYTWNDCINQLLNGQDESQLCTFQRFPLHPQPQHRRQCGATLMKKIRNSCGKISLYPQLIYCYTCKSVVESPQDMLRRPDFIDECELWRKKKMLDVSWRSPLSLCAFQLCFPSELGLVSTIRAYSAFENVIYSSILNLPRHKCFL